MGINTGWASQLIVDNHLKERGENKKLNELCDRHDELMSKIASERLLGNTVDEEDWKQYLLTECFIMTLTGTNKERKEARDQLIKLCGLDVKKIEAITGPEAYNRVLGGLFGGSSN